MQSRHASLVADMKRLETQAAPLAREAELLKTLLGLRRGEPGEAATASQASSPAPPPIDVSPSDAIGDVVVRILEGQTRPIHISELMKTLTEMGVEIPGKGNAANVISHLVRDPRVVRPSRGMYALRAWGLEDMPVKRRKKTTKRSTTHRRGSASSGGATASRRDE